jgi:hypothetical protein
MTRRPMRGGLHIDSIGVTPKEEKEINDRWDTYHKVEKKMEGLGFAKPEKPSLELLPITPEILIGASPEEHADRYTRHLAWHAYATAHLVDAKAMLLQTSNSLKDIETKLRNNYRDINKGVPRAERTTEKEMEDKIWVDSKVQEKQIEKQEYTQLKDALDNKAGSIKLGMDVISREVELRKTEMHGTTRSTNMERGSAIDRHLKFRKRD